MASESLVHRDHVNLLLTTSLKAKSFFDQLSSNLSVVVQSRPSLIKEDASEEVEVTF